MRLLITGKTRSGKSTTLHAFLAHALRRNWAHVLLLDGKGAELHYYANTRLPNNTPLTYLGPNDIAQWNTELQQVAAGLEKRFRDLAGRGLREAAADDPRWLVVIDEVQVGCGHREYGRDIRQHLTRLAEQSAALGDVLVLTCQREQNSLPPSVRWNCNAKLRTLGAGFFHYQPDGLPHVAGRLPYIAPQAALDQLSIPLNGAGDLAIAPSNLIKILGADQSQAQDLARANATLYLGKDGAGKTFQLQHHPLGHAVRRVYADLQESHRGWLIAILEQCGGAAPPKAAIHQLQEMAVLAIRAEPTALLLDNLDAANTKERASIHALIDAASIAALAARPPDTPALERKINPFISRCRVERIPPLDQVAARALAGQHLPPDIPAREATLKRIADMATGHPATIVSLCHQAKQGTLSELRHLEHTPKRFNLVWLLLIPLLILLFIWRYRVDSYLLAALIMAALMLFRPLLYRYMRRK